MTKKKTTIDFWKAFWDERAKHYQSDREIDRGSSQSIPSLELIEEEKLIEALSPQKSDYVLDVGCGTGEKIMKIGGFVKQIVGMDISEEQLKRAERNIQRQKIGNVRLLIGSVTKIDFPDSTFDKVICASVLQYLNDEECKAAIIEMIRVCKDGGRIIIHAKNRTSLYGVIRGIIKSITSSVGRNRLPDYYRPRRWYEKMISAHGGGVMDFDSFGIFNFPLLPPVIGKHLLLFEMKNIKSKKVKAFGVNYKMTIEVDKRSQP